MDLRARAKSLKTDIPAVFMAMKRKETPAAAKILAAAAVAYALSPVDIIPDFIPVLGYLDDLILLPFLIGLTIRLIPKEVMQECRVQAGGLWADGKPQRWYFALPVLLLWAVIAVLILKLFWK